MFAVHFIVMSCAVICAMMLFAGVGCLYSHACCVGAVALLLDVVCGVFPCCRADFDVSAMCRDAVCGVVMCGYAMCDYATMCCV